MSSLKDNRTLAILRAAAAGQYGILSAIAYARSLTTVYDNFLMLISCRYNIEQLTALVQAAEAKRSPLIIQLFPTTLKHLPLLAHAAAIAVKTATVPLSLHIDHAQNVDHIRKIIATLPVDSVMVDMSHFDEAENLEKTRILTKECHAKGIAVEAESGRIEGGEDGIADTGDLEGMCYQTVSKQAAWHFANPRSQHSSRLPPTSTTSSPPASTSSRHPLATYMATMVPPGPKKAKSISIASKLSTSKSTSAS